MTIKHSFAKHRFVVASILVLAMGVVDVATASPTASGKAYDMNISISLLGTPVLTVTPQDQVEFSNLAVAFDDSKTKASLFAGDPLVATLSTGALSASTQWIPGDSFLAVGSSASVVNADLSVPTPNVNIDANASVLDVNATQILATTIIEGSCPATANTTARQMQTDADIVGDVIYENEFELQNLAATNVADIPGLQIDVDGNTVLGIPANPLPNTTIDIGDVGTLLLNKQTFAGDGISNLASTVDGLLLNVNLTVASTPLLQAYVNLAHSEASINCN